MPAEERADADSTEQAGGPRRGEEPDAAENRVAAALVHEQRRNEEEGQTAPGQEMSEEKGREEPRRHPQGDGNATGIAGQGDDEALGDEATVDCRALDGEAELAPRARLAHQPLASRDTDQHERARDAERPHDGPGPPSGRALKRA